METLEHPNTSLSRERLIALKEQYEESLQKEAELEKILEQCAETIKRIEAQNATPPNEGTKENPIDLDERGDKKRLKNFRKRERVAGPTLAALTTVAAMNSMIDVKPRHAHAAEEPTPIEVSVEDSTPIQNPDTTYQFVAEQKIDSSALQNKDTVAAPEKHFSPELQGSYEVFDEAFFRGESRGTGGWDAVSDKGALGRWQIVPKWWFHEIGLDPNSEEDKQKFLADHDLQRKLFKIVLHTLFENNDANPRMTAAEYFAGNDKIFYGTPKGNEINDGHSTLNQYVDNFMEHYNDVLQEKRVLAINETNTGGGDGSRTRFRKN